jgi:LPS-assembly protein
MSPIKFISYFSAVILVLTSLSITEGARAQTSDAKNSNGQDGPLSMQAEKISGRPDRELQLENNVKIERGPTLIEADRVDYDIVDDKINAKGNVVIDRAGDHFTGNALKLKMDTGVGYMDSPVYRLLRKNAQGSAERIDFESQDSVTVVKGVFTTCEGPDPDWYLKSSKLTLDNDRQIGEAKGAVLVFKGIPIAGTPYVSFPLSEERVSGFLAPTIATSTTGGLEVTTPYYLDIAPNRDLTLYPQYISRRGLMMGAHARYLDRDYSGNTRTEFLNSDAVIGDGRYALSTIHKHNLAPGLDFYADLNAASDDNYSKDFPLSRTAARLRLLTRNLQLTYAGPGWNGLARLTEYQILQDVNAPITAPYGRLPQLNLNQFGYSDSGLSWNVNSEFTRFTHATKEQGDRLIFNPRISYALNKPGYFVRPSLSLHGTTYNLDQVTNASMNAPSRVLPTVSIDSGLIFERDATFFGRPALNTLEPRLFYTYTPFVRQDANIYPTFDSNEADFNFAQIFRENRFIGGDRIGDANTVTAALTSRFLEVNGEERLRMAVAQRFAFEDQRVVLSTLSGTTDTRSDILFLTSGRVSRELRLDGNLQYSQTNKEINRVNFGSFWQPAPMKLLNVQYRRDIRNLNNGTDTNFELFDVSGQWPLSSRWYGVGRLNYLIKDSRLGQSLFGVEYRADCWIFRFVGQRIPTAANETNTTFFLQLEFNGLSTIGSNPMRALRANVPGYQKLTQPD